jgi:hypothetical protein
MRVEVVETLPQQSNAAFKAVSDAAVDRALKSFVGAIGAEDSLFAVEPGAVLGSLESPAPQEPALQRNDQLCVAAITLKFRDEKLGRNRGAHFSLVEKLSELLKQAGSADSLTALLSIVPASTSADQPEFALAMCLQASGNSPEQAALRWGLGLAHVQQALLFTSRSLRQQLAQREA